MPSDPIREAQHQKSSTLQSGGKESARGERRVRRRKIALACEPCRERKSRCDGRKPICGSCHRRSFTLEQCVYNSDNARSASNDAYIKVLHSRIRELEQACLKSGVTVPALNSQQGGPNVQQEQATDSQNTRPDVVERGRGHYTDEPALFAVPESNLAPSFSVPAQRASISEQGIDIAIRNSPRTVNSEPQHRSSFNGARLATQARTNLRSPSENGFTENTRLPEKRSTHDEYSTGNPSPLCSSDVRGPVTAMGAIFTVDEEEDNKNTPDKEYYGSSSAASFMRLARESEPQPSRVNMDKQGVNGQTGNNMPGSNHLESTWRECCKPSPRMQYEDFCLPPRPLADHLLQCYWDRVYCLYPFFHRPSFEAAYEDLWTASSQGTEGSNRLNIGLGSTQDSGKNSIVFHCALNAIFALGCHFSDIPPADREEVANSFFLRLKRFLGVELLDVRTIGVVQAFLLAALYFQSTPYPNRCWNSIGLACRIAQGIGLHTETVRDPLEPLEMQIRRRTWHGCVMMDLIVSMTFGRPSMTSHLPTVPLPSTLSDLAMADGRSSEQELGDTPSHLAFYGCTIELYKILDDIMSEVYMAWRNGTDRNASMTDRRTRQGGLDVIIDLDAKSFTYEANLPPFLSWTDKRKLPDGLDKADAVIYERQTHVLHASFIHLRLLLYRPIFTQFWTARGGNPGGSAPKSDSAAIDLSSLGSNMLYSSFVVRCATACVLAAIDLADLIHSNYRTPVTGPWWYNGFYISTASVVLIMCRSCLSTLEQLNISKIDATWIKCEEILSHMASFSVSARNTLNMLQSMYNKPQPSNFGPPAPSHDASNQSKGSQGAVHPIPEDTRDPGPSTNCDPSGQMDPFHPEISWQGGSSFMNWDGALDCAPNEFAFFQSFDIPDPQSWVPDMPG